MILYYFRTLPIPLITYYLRELQSPLNLFIWALQCWRFRNKILYRTKSSTGMDVPNVKLYYHASILDQVKVRWSQLTEKQWAYIELATIGHSLKGLIGALSMGISIPSTPYLTMRADTRSWIFSNSKHLQQFSSNYSSLPLCSIEFFTNDLSISNWMDSGISTIGHIFDRSTLK